MRPHAHAAAERAARARLAAVTGQTDGAAAGGVDEAPDAPLSHADRLAGSLRQDRSKETKVCENNQHFAIMASPCAGAFHSSCSNNKYSAYGSVILSSAVA